MTTRMSTPPGRNRRLRHPAVGGRHLRIAHRAARVRIACRSAARAEIVRAAGPPGRPPASRPRGRSLLWAGAAVAAALAGGISGFALRGPAAKPTTGSSVTSTSSNSASPFSSALGGKAPCTTALNSAAPYICVNQLWGDGDTEYVVHGNGYVPFSAISIRLVGPGISRLSADRPLADQAGTFNYAIDQGHYFFRGQIPPGEYHVVVNAPGRSQLKISFQVYKVDLHPPADTGPPPSPPPSGGGPPPGGGP